MTAQEKLAQIESLAKNIKDHVEAIMEEAEVRESNGEEFDHHEIIDIATAESADNVASQILDIINQK